MCSGRLRSHCCIASTDRPPGTIAPDSRTRVPGCSHGCGSMGRPEIRDGGASCMPSGRAGRLADIFPQVERLEPFQLAYAVHREDVCESCVFGHPADFCFGRIRISVGFGGWKPLGMMRCGNGWRWGASPAGSRCLSGWPGRRRQSRRSRARRRIGSRFPRDVPDESGHAVGDGYRVTVSHY
jgi:hypothetical protein